MAVFVQEGQTGMGDCFLKSVDKSFCHAHAQDPYQECIFTTSDEKEDKDKKIIRLSVFKR